MSIDHESFPRVIEARAEPPPPARRAFWWPGALSALMLLGVSFLLVGTALTVGRFAGRDFADARRTGRATVEECTLSGPITMNGFGYHDRCTVAIRWMSGDATRATIDKPGFFEGARVGDTFDIGDNGGGYSRPGTAERPGVAVAARLIGALGLLPLLAAAIYLREGFRAARRH